MTWVRMDFKMRRSSQNSKQQKRQALESLLFVTEKKDGRIKSRKCAMGNKQQTYEGYDKSAGSSPTVTTRGLILALAIDAHEGRDVATVDIKTAFLHADNDKETIMELVMTF